jgi:RsiW-degrading membrane proteinase PrsW (M82 family)
VAVAVAESPSLCLPLDRDSVLRSTAMFIALVAAAPSLALLTYFYLRDRYEREPIGHVVAAYLLGMFALAAAQGATLMIADWVSSDWLHTGGEPARLFDAFVLAGGVEELAKWVVLVAAVYAWREFDEPMDGLLYGVAIALGFATLENLLFLSSRGLAIAWQRAIFAVPAHALFGGCMGFYVGRAKFAPTRHFWLSLSLSLLVPVGFHGAYDFALLHGLGWKVWTAVTLLSLAFWVFVLRRVKRAQKSSPYRPKTMMPSDFRALGRGK